MKTYIDFDSCYYNIARRIYSIAPWTVITNKFNHIISVPYWLEGRFGVEKITYFAPPVKIRSKTKCFVRTFNVDSTAGARNTMSEFLTGILEGVKVLDPDAYIIHKDSIVAEVEPLKLSAIRSAIRLPCTIGTGRSEEEAKNDCKVKKSLKRKNPTNIVYFMLYVIPMVVFYLVRRKP